jgi:osmotically-inducible protein OsmY
LWKKQHRNAQPCLQRRFTARKISGHNFVAFSYQDKEINTIKPSKIMADRNRNRQEPYRSQSDWNEERQRRHSGDEPNYSNTENRGYGSSGRGSTMQSRDSGWDNRNERQANSNRQGEYGGYDQSNWQSDYDRSYGMSGGGTSGYSDFGGNYGSSGSRGGSRGLYDRDYEGMNRSNYENRENRIGGANYGNYGDRGRYAENQQFGGLGGSNYGGSQYSGYRDSGSRNREYGRGDSDERSWWDRTKDEVSSWFGDEDAERRRDRERNQSGQYRGKGPRNYSRSDERIKEDVNDRLSDDPFIDASEIDVTVNSGEVTLTGTVDHRSTKRRAEDIAEAVSGVKNVENRIRVSVHTGSQSSGVSGMSGTPGSAMNNPSGSGSSSMDNPSGTSSQSSSAVPGSERGRQKENSYAK